MTTAPYLNPVFDPNDLDGRNTDEHEAELKQAIEAPVHLVDMDTGELHVGAGLPALSTSAAMDGEWISRAARLATLERQAEDARSAFVHAHYQYGEILREYKDLCLDEETRWIDFCDRQGLALSSANRLIKVAQAVRQLPSLRDLAAKQYTRALTLIEGLDAEDLAQVAEGSGPLRLEDIDSMSCRQLKREVRKLRDDKDKLVKEETKTLASELKGVKEDLAAARAALDPDLATARKTAREVRAATQALADQVLKLFDQLKPLDKKDAEHLRPALESSIQGGSLLLRDLWQTWQEQVLELGLDD